MLVQRSAANHATALIALDPDALAYWGRAEGLTATHNATRAVGSEVRRHVETCVDELSGRLNRVETIKDFRVLDHNRLWRPAGLY